MPPQFVRLNLSKPYGYRGDSVGILADTDSDNIRIKIYNPNKQVIYDQAWTPGETRSIPVPNNAAYGHYTVTATVDGLEISERWFTVADVEQLTQASLPITWTMLHCSFQFKADKSFTVTSQDGRSFTVQLPNLPAEASVSAQTSSYMFVVTVTHPQITVNLIFIKLRDAVKLAIDGTASQTFNWRFKLDTASPLRRFMSRLLCMKQGEAGRGPNTIQFNWRDLAKAGRVVDYDPDTKTVTVSNVPATFSLDPNFGVEENDSGQDRNMNDYIQAVEVTNSQGAGTGDSMTAYAKVWNNQPWKMNLYAADHTPVTNGETNSGLGDSTWDWHTLTFGTGPSIADSTNYHLAGWAGGTAYIRQDDDVAAVGHEDAETYDGWPNPLAGTGKDPYPISIYCTFTVSGGGLSIPVAMHHLNRIYKKIRG